jgi:glycosyltransferase involved in cell wall biosynthesis
MSARASYSVDDLRAPNSHETGLTVAVILPCYRVEREIAHVIASMPAWVTYILAVNDCSPDRTGEVLEELARQDPRLEVLTHEMNHGVGGAVVTGFKRALELKADFVVKMDGDGQMDPAELPRLLVPLLDGSADYSKGNRFHSKNDMGHMPSIRRFGNIGLTFLTKLASGYWHVFDPQNGYVAIPREWLEKLALESLDKTYFFENSLLVNLNIEGARVADVSMRAVYGEEESNLKIGRILRRFPPRLLRATVRRFLVKYLVYDVSPIVPYFIGGTLLMTFGVLFGGYHWILSNRTGMFASTGTVMVATLPFIIGFELCLQALHLDIVDSPRPGQPMKRIRPEHVPDYFGREYLKTTPASVPQDTTLRPS